MAKVTPSLLAVVGSGAAFTAQPSPRKGASLFRDRVISRRARISAKLGMVPQSSLALLLLLWETRLIGRVTHAGGDGELKPPGKKKFITRDEEPEQ